MHLGLQASHRLSEGPVALAENSAKMEIAAASVSCGEPGDRIAHRVIKGNCFPAIDRNHVTAHRRSSHKHAITLWTPYETLQLAAHPG